jgi:hypothetical protein
MSAIVRFWLGITIGFEAITLYRVGESRALTTNTESVELLNQVSR